MKALKITLALFTLIIPDLLFSQPPLPTFDPVVCDTCPNTPIDTMIGILAIVGLLYACYKLKTKKNW
jgi:hypothetical protein